MKILTILIVLISCFSCCLSASASSRQESSNIEQAKTADAETEKQWSNLATDGPQSTEAAMWFIDRPDAAIKLFQDRLKPLRLSKERFNRLVDQLGSDDEATWHAAYRELSYFDPRLLGNAVEVVEMVSEGEQLQRLGGILCKRSINEFLDPAMQSRYFSRPFSLKSRGVDTVMVTSGSPNFQIPATIDQIQTGFRKLEWDQMVRALAVLNAIKSLESIAIIEQVAKGHQAAGQLNFPNICSRKKPKLRKLRSRQCLAGGKSCKHVAVRQPMLQSNFASDPIRRPSFWKLVSIR